MRHATKPALARPDAYAQVLLDGEHVIANQSGLFFSLEDMFSMRRPVAIGDNGIAVVEVRGSLEPDPPGLLQSVGLATGYATIRGEMQAAIAEGARGIVLRVDSPGGLVSGCPECASFIDGVAEKMPIVAWADGMACSAAYWLASSCNYVFASPSAEVGSIGTIIRWADDSGFWEEMGIRRETMTNDGADLKAIFSGPLSETQRGFVQEHLNAIGRDFQNAVSANRPMLSADAFRGGWYYGATAESMGLVDALATLDEAIDMCNAMANERLA